jgi:hypothetical protein
MTRLVYDQRPGLLSRFGTSVRAWFGGHARPTIDRRKLTRRSSSPERKTVKDLIDRVLVAIETLHWEQPQHRMARTHLIGALGVLLHHPKAPSRAAAFEGLSPVHRNKVSLALEFVQAQAPLYWSKALLQELLLMALCDGWPDTLEHESLPFSDPSHEGHVIHATYRRTEALPGPGVIAR